MAKQRMKWTRYNTKQKLEIKTANCTQYKDKLDSADLPVYWLVRITLDHRATRY